MPQMAPIWWSTLFMIFITSYIIMMVLLYYYNIYSLNMKITKNDFYKNKMNWKW